MPFEFFISFNSFIEFFFGQFEEVFQFTPFALENPKAILRFSPRFKVLVDLRYQKSILVIDLGLLNLKGLSLS